MRDKTDEIRILSTESGYFYKMRIISTEYGYIHEISIISTERGYFQKMQIISTKYEYIHEMRIIYTEHGTWILPRYADVSMIISTTRMKEHNLTHNLTPHLYMLHRQNNDSHI